MESGSTGPLTGPDVPQDVVLPRGSIAGDNSVSSGSPGRRVTTEVRSPMPAGPYPVPRTPVVQPMRSSCLADELRLKIEANIQGQAERRRGQTPGPASGSGLDRCLGRQCCGRHQVLAIPQPCHKGCC